MIAVVIPTIRGREALLERTLTAYRDCGSEVTTIIVRDRPTIGQAWGDGADAALNVEGVRFIHMGADDVEMHPGALEAAARWTLDGVYPSPRIENVDGSLHSCGTMGGGMLLPECGDGTVCGTSPFPFMRAEMWAAIRPCPQIGYYADDWLAWAVREQGLEVRVARGYSLTHLEGTVGRARSVARSAADRQAFLEAVADRALQPVEG